MKKTNFLLCVLVETILLCACEVISIPNIQTIATNKETYSGETTVTATNQPSPTVETIKTTLTPTPSKTQYTSEYLQKLNELQNDPNQSFWLEYISPDGQWITYEPLYENGSYKIEITNLLDSLKTFNISLDGSFLNLTDEEMKESGAQYLTWSPDSASLLLIGLAFHGGPYRYLCIINFSDRQNISKSIVRWNYEGQPFLSWSPDSSRILIWFGPEIELGKMGPDHYSEVAWIVSREGKILYEFDVAGMKSPVWVGQSLYVIRNGDEIWKIKPELNVSEKIFTNKIPVEKIIDSNPENTRLLLIEGEPPYNLLVFDLRHENLARKFTSGMKPYEVTFFNIYPTPTDYVGFGQLSLFVFDWSTYQYRFYKDPVYSEIWSPIENGFIIERPAWPVHIGYEYTPFILDVVYPYQPKPTNIRSE